MNSICPHIELAIRLAINAGYKIKEKSEGWSKAKQVFIMDKKLSDELKMEVEKLAPNLQYWSDPGSPHNGPEEGFYCNECTVGVAFPVTRRVIR